MRGCRAGLAKSQDVVDLETQTSEGDPFATGPSCLTHTRKHSVIHEGTVSQMKER